MGALKDVGAIGDEAEDSYDQFRAATQQTLIDGYAYVIPGLEASSVPIPLHEDEGGLPEPVRLAAAGILTTHYDDFDAMWGDMYFKTMEAIDDNFPSAGMPPAVPLIDPTVPLIPILKWDLGIPDLPEWLLKHLPPLMINPTWPPDFLAAVTKALACEPKDLANMLVDMDKDGVVEADRVIEAFEAICPITIPTITIPPIPPPPFPWAFNFAPVPSIGFLIPNWEWPNLNFSFSLLLEIVIKAGIKFGAAIPELILKIVNGIEEFLIACVMFLIETIIAMIMEVMAFLLKMVTYVAGLMTFLAKIIPGMIVAILGWALGTGMIAYIAAGYFDLI